MHLMVHHALALRIVIVAVGVIELRHGGGVGEVAGALRRLRSRSTCRCCGGGLRCRLSSRR